MILSGSSLAYYLADRGLVGLDSVVDGAFLVVTVPRRNQNFKVIRRGAPGFFVKQVRDGTPDAVATLKCEATCYRLAQSGLELEPLAALLPGFYCYDPENNVLVLQLLQESENLREHSDRTGGFSPDLARQIGAAFGSYHSLPLSRITEAAASPFPDNKPWILSFHSQTFPLGTMNPGAAQLHDILHSYPEYTRALDDLSGDWQVDALIHGDVKWDNCMVYPAEDGPGSEFKIVDWELASLGDACWDVGAILQAYLTSWVFSMPDTGASPAAALVRQARFALDDVAPAIGAFWESYASARGLEEARSRRLLERSMKYGAARMVQSVFEIAIYSSQLSPVAVRVLQLSYNILADPQEAIESLLVA